MMRVAARSFAVLLWLMVAAPALLCAQQGAASPAPAAREEEGQREKSSGDAERVARTLRTIEGTKKLIGELQAEIDDPEGEYKQSQAEFLAIDEEREQKQQDLEALQAEGKTRQAAALEADLARLEPKWRLVKERFELKIEGRKQLLEQLDSLKQKVAKDQETVDRLMGVSRPADADAGPALSGIEGGRNSARGQGAADEPAMRPLTPGMPEPDLATPEGDSPETANASMAGMGMTAGFDADQSEEVAAAAKLASEKLVEAEEAEDAARSVAERIGLLQESIEAARGLRETSRKEVENSEETIHELEASMQRLIGEGASPADLQEVQDKLVEAREGLRELRTEVRERTDTLDDMQAELAELQGEQIKVLREADQRRSESDAAQKHLADLKNPFTPRNLMQWGLDHGPEILSILMSMAGLVWLSRVLEGRLVGLMANRHASRGSVEERENRAKTLVGVFRNAATMVIVAGGVLMVLDEVGVPIAPLLGGAAAFGLAVAFGAQSLIKDFFSGFMILLEQQYLVNDVIKIGDIAGQVERISLRTTVLRDLEGRVHFIPHGQITSTTNMTHGWSRAVFDIGVAYKEDVNRVMDVLMALAMQMRHDAEFGPLILEDPVMLGVDSLGDSAVMIKFHLKTRPLRQWPVKRELLRRIKMEFDKQGIEIPYPHRTVFYQPVAAGTQPMEPHSSWSRRVA